MTDIRSSLIDYATRSKIRNGWHFLSYHFGFFDNGVEHPLAKSIIDACVDCERALPGAGFGAIDKLAGPGGRVKYEPHYEQLLQSLAELFVVRQVLKHPWPGSPTFRLEPTTGSSGKNPEMTVSYGAYTIGVEVKAPSLLAHMRSRALYPMQRLSRQDHLNELAKEMFPDYDIPLPKDHPVLRYLRSANDKFREFRALDENFYGILVIVWDDFINEPISALHSGSSGLFTPNSFSRGPDGKAEVFKNVDVVVLIRQLHQFIRATRDEPLADGKNFALDYGDDADFPPKAFIEVPNGRVLPEEVRWPMVLCFQAYPPQPMMGAEYIAGDVVFWQ